MAYTYITVLFDMIWFLFINSSKNLKDYLKLENKNNEKSPIFAEFDYYWYAPILAYKSRINSKSAISYQFSEISGPYSKI
jgi:hypothetical protein